MSARASLVLAVGALILGGCATATVQREGECLSTAVLDEPGESTPAKPLLAASDGNVAVRVERLVIPNGPGSWAVNAIWDEYTVTVRALGRQAIAVNAVTLRDARGKEVAPGAPRCTDTPWDAPAGFASSAMLSLVAPGGFLALASAAIETAAVKLELKRRTTRLPQQVSTDVPTRLDLFFPVTPQPSSIEIAYIDSGGVHRFRVDTRAALAKSHAKPPPLLMRRVPPRFPFEAVRRDVHAGYVKARLTVDMAGNVRAIRVLESSPPGLFDDAAKAAFSRWRYLGGTEERTAEARLDFNEQ